MTGWSITRRGGRRLRLPPPAGAGCHQGCGTSWNNWHQTSALDGSLPTWVEELERASGLRHSTCCPTPCPGSQLRKKIPAQVAFFDGELISPTATLSAGAGVLPALFGAVPPAPERACSSTTCWPQTSDDRHSLRASPEQSSTQTPIRLRGGSCGQLGVGRAPHGPGDLDAVKTGGRALGRQPLRYDKRNGRRGKRSTSTFLSSSLAWRKSPRSYSLIWAASVYSPR